MKIQHVVLTLSFCILLNISCINKPTLPIEFDRIHNTKSSIVISKDHIGDPGIIAIYKNYIILANDKQTPLIEIYDIKSGEKISEFLNIGNGPLEVLTIGNIQIIPLTGDLMVSDLFKRKLIKYNIDEIILNQSIHPIVLFERGEKSSLMFDKMGILNDHIIAESRDPKGRILQIDRKDNKIEYFLPYPDKKEVDKNLNDVNNAKLYASSLTFNQRLNKVALATYHAKMIDIIEVKNDKMNSIWSYIKSYPGGVVVVPMGDESAVAHTRESTNCFIDMSSTDFYIYTLFSGKKLEDPSYPYGQEVYVVSWDGKETYKIILDKSINRLAVDANDEFIYGITPEMDIVRFKIHQ